MRSVGCVFVLASASAWAGGSKVYVSLGDSIAFGYTTVAASTEPTFADRGFVSLYADWLATQDGGVRPGVVNLGITGETTAGFFDTMNPARQYNLTYGGESISQAAKLTQVAQEQAALGNTIETVSMVLGANDIFDLVLEPGFIDLPGSQQFGLILGALQTALDNYTLAAAHVRSTLPDADLLVVGYYNPFAVVPESPAFGLAPVIIDALNQISDNIATTFGGRYVDVYSAFVGNEATFTQILLDPPVGTNPHPTSLGYEAIAGRMIPAPAAWGVLAAAGVFAARRRRAA